MSHAKSEPFDAPFNDLAACVRGYARVSTDGQALALQVESLRAAGATKLYRETASGAQRNRTQLAKLLEDVQPGDVVLVTRLDRLARSTRDLLNVLGALAEKAAAFRSLGDPWADTTTPHGRLMLTVLGGLAEFERELIRTRTGEGRARAKAEGRKMGRPHKLTPHQQQEARRRHDQGESLSAIARSYNVHHATISRLCR
jgi:DNA invertase Pin-like site-specific DNA recombinase